jgi:transposase
MGANRTAIPPAKRGGRKREVKLREVMNGVMYILSTGCQWRALPKELPPRSTASSYFDLWIYDGTLDRVHQVLYERCREQAGRNVEPTACIIDSQSVKGAEKGGRAATRTALMRASSSRAKSGISW